MESSTAAEIDQNGALYDRSSALRFLYDRLFKPVRSDFVRMLLFIMIWAIVFFVVSFIEGTLILGEIDFKLTSDVGYLEDFYTFSLLATVMLFFWLTKRVFDIFYEVFWGEEGFQSGIDWNRISKSEYHAILSESNDFIQHKGNMPVKWRIFYILLWVGATGYFIVELLLEFANTTYYGFWYGPHHLLGAIGWLAFIFVLLVLIGPELIWRYIAIIRETRRIVAEVDGKGETLTIVASPMHGARGFRCLGQLALRMSIVPISALIALFVWVFFSSLLLEHAILATGMLVALSVISFFYPLMTIIRVVKRRKEKKLSDLSMKLRNIHIRLSGIADGGKSLIDEEIRNLSSEIQLYQVLHDDAAETPVWPFDTSVFSKFILIVIAPFIFIFFEHFIYR
jgi:hypothetical protein